MMDNGAVFGCILFSHFIKGPNIATD